MESKGIILRLIDVVLIILVGFVSVADLEPKGRFDLPRSEKSEEESEEPIDMLIVSVKADEENSRIETREVLQDDGEVTVASLQIPGIIYDLIWYIGEEEFSDKALTNESLEEKLEAFQNREIKQIVISPSPDSPVEGTVTPYDICKRLRLPEPGLDLTYEETP